MRPTLSTFTSQCAGRLFAHLGRLSATVNALMLGRSLKHRLWDGSKFETRQVKDIGPVTRCARRQPGACVCWRLCASCKHQLMKVLTEGLTCCQWYHNYKDLLAPWPWSDVDVWQVLSWCVC